MITRKLSPAALGSLAAVLLLTANQSSMAQKPSETQKSDTAPQSEMNNIWGKQVTKLRADGAKRGELFRCGQLRHVHSLGLVFSARQQG